MIGETPYRVGPSAIAARMNPYGKGVLDNPGNRRVCLNNRDPRQRGLFNAAWTLRYVAACAYGGAASVAMGAAAGPHGFIHRQGDHPQPCFDSLDGAAVYPAFHVMADLARAGARPLIEMQSSEPRKGAGLAWREDSRVVLWLANLTAEPLTIRVGGFGGARLQASVLDGSAFKKAVASLDALDALTRALDEPELNLDAYAVARVEVDNH